MTRTILAAAALAVALASPALAQDPVAVPALKPEPPAVCRGVVLDAFEANLPANTVRYTVSEDSRGPFAEVFERASEKRASLRRHDPDGVTVYARPGADLLLAYRVGDCVVVIVPTKRAPLDRLIRMAFGHSA